MPTIRYRAIDRRKPASDWLRQHARNVTSQHGQDGVIAKIFEVIGTTNKCCCEFGAWDGKYLSNTYSLIQEQGWTGYLIEGSTERHADILKNHHHSPNVHAIREWVDFEGENTIEKILTRAGAPKDIDLMVIDVDGVDYHIWESLETIRPRVVAIEYNPIVPNEVVFIQDRDWAITQGNSLAALIELGRKKGYQLVSAYGDAFFVQRRDYPKFGIEDNSIDAMYTPGNRELKLFFGYDGKMYTAGHRVVGWHVAKPFEADTLQVLTPEEFEVSVRAIAEKPARSSGEAD